MLSAEMRKTRTCRRSFVSLCWLAGTAGPHGVYGGHSEAIVDVAVELEHGRVVVPRYLEQLFPVAWLPLAFFILNNKLC